MESPEVVYILRSVHETRHRSRSCCVHTGRDTLTPTALPAFDLFEVLD